MFMIGAHPTFTFSENFIGDPIRSAAALIAGTSIWNFIPRANTCLSANTSSMFMIGAHPTFTFSRFSIHQDVGFDRVTASTFSVTYLRLVTRATAVLHFSSCKSSSQPPTLQNASNWVSLPHVIIQYPSLDGTTW